VRRLLDGTSSSKRRVCGLMEVPRTTYRYRSCRDDSELRERLLELRGRGRDSGIDGCISGCGARPSRSTTRRCSGCIGVSGVGPDGEAYPTQARGGKRLERVLRPRFVQTAPNQEWSIDFASNVTAVSQRIRVLSVIDSFTRQSLALEGTRAFPAAA
jgi:putative transposase